MISLHTYVFIICQLGRPRSTDAPVATSMPSTQTTDLNIIVQSTEPGFLREMTDSKTRARNVQDASEESLSAEK